MTTITVKRMSGAKEKIELPEDVDFFRVHSEFDNGNDEEFFIRDIFVAAADKPNARAIAASYHDKDEKITRVVPIKPNEAAVWKARGELRDKPKERDHAPS